MKKRLLTAALAAAMTMAMGITALAGQWAQNETGWWWINDDGSNPAATWKWLDGNQDGIFECYYFDNMGYMMANTTTPDGYTVNADGAWTVDGGVQLQFSGNSASSSATDNSTSYITDIYDRLGVYATEKGEYFDLSLGADGGLAGFLYDEDDDFQGVFNFEKVNNTTFKDNTKSRTLTFINDNAFTLGTKTYTR